MPSFHSLAIAAVGLQLATNGVAIPTDPCVQPDIPACPSSDTTHSLDDPPKRPELWKPEVGQTWQIVLTGVVDEKKLPFTPNVDVWDVDLEKTPASTIRALHDAGKKVICYFSAGTYEGGRTDSCLFKRADMGCKMKSWEEWWLDLSSTNVRNIMTDRIKMAATKECDAIDPDNVDGYNNLENGLKLQRKDSINYMEFLYKEANKYNLSVGLKNAGEIIANVTDFVHFSVNEECAYQDECEPGEKCGGECKTFRDGFIAKDKPVFNIEYPTKRENGNTTWDEERVDNICNHRDQAKFNDKFSTLIKFKQQVDGWVHYCKPNLCPADGEDPLTCSTKLLPMEMK